MSKKTDRPGFYQTSHERFSRHQIKKTKKISEENNQKQLMDFVDKLDSDVLYRIYSSQQDLMPGHYKLGVWRKNMCLLTRTHLPSYVKFLDYIELNQSLLIPSKATINPKKNTKTDILIQDPVTQKTRLIKMETFPILLCLQRLVFYRLSFAQFEKMMQGSEFTVEDLRKIFNFYLEELEPPFSDGECLLWPAVVLEGLNYKFEQIQSIMINFKISNKDSLAYLAYLSKVMGEALSSQVLSESVQRAEVGELQQNIQNQRQRSQIEQQPVRPNDTVNIQPPLQQQNPPNYQSVTTCLTTENNFCIWLIGTAYFSFSNTFIMPWGTFSPQLIKSAFSTYQIYSGLLKESNLLIQCFNKFKKLQQAELKGDQYKLFLQRLCLYKSEDQGEIYCIPLRFQYIKGCSKKILIKLLKRENTELRWVSTDTTVANYTLPNITRKQMNFLYLCRKLAPMDVVTTYFYRDFLYLPQKQVGQIFRSFYPQFFTSQAQAYRQRCKSCHYLIRDMPFKCCYFCQVFCHQECTNQNKKNQSNTFIQELFPEGESTAWVCQRCQPCTICMEAVGQDNLFCSTCFSYFHFECGRIKCHEPQQASSSSLPQPALVTQQSVQSNHSTPSKYICQSCLKCKMCSHKLKDNEYLVMENEFYCSQCAEKIKSNNHCHVCMKKKEGGSTMKWIQCGHESCLKWVHQICDPQYIGVVKNPTASDPYLCPLCRIVEMRKIYVQVINSLIVFDEAQFFTQPSYKTIPFYDSIISHPMCFAVMRQKSMQGEYDDNPFKKLSSDFNLIVSNALKFNMPKDTAHVQAKILKILGQKALQKYKPVFLPQLKSVITGSIFQTMKTLKLELHRDINAHYPQILLNYHSQRSYIQIKQPKKKPQMSQSLPSLPSQLSFSTSLLLNNHFKSSTIIFHLKKQKVKISNLFTMPKSQNQRGIWHSIQNDLCYYHPNNQIVYSCDLCCQSYCCIKECIKHRVCACGVKGCKCDDYACGCPPLKDKQRKSIQAKLWAKFGDHTKTYREILMDITQNYKYCLKCAYDKINTRICAACDGLCSWGYFRCPHCSKVWHKKCYPHSISASYVTNPPTAGLPPSMKPHYLQSGLQQQPQQSLFSGASSSVQSYSIKSPASLNTINPQLTYTRFIGSSTCATRYCRQCLSMHYPNNYQQALSLVSKGTLVKLSKISRYMRIFVQVYFNQGVRITPYQIQQLVINNYDQFSMRELLFKEYQNNYQIIQRFRDFSFKTNAAIQRSCAEYINDYVQVSQARLANMNHIISGSHQQGNQGLNHYYLESMLQLGRNQSVWIDSKQYLTKAKRLWWKYFRTLGSGVYDLQCDAENWQPIKSWKDVPSIQTEDFDICMHLEKVQQVRQNVIKQNYTYKDYNAHIKKLLYDKQNIINIFELPQTPQPLPHLHPSYQPPHKPAQWHYNRHHQHQHNIDLQHHPSSAMQHHNHTQQQGGAITEKMHQQKQHTNTIQSSFISEKQHRSYLSSLSYTTTIMESYLKSAHGYRFSLVYQPRTMPFQYKLNHFFKKKSYLQMAVKEFLLGIYQQSKKCLRRGSTCILAQNVNSPNNNSTSSNGKDYWAVLKKWGKGTKQMHIVLQKRQQKWFLNIDGRGEVLVNEIQQITSEIYKINPDVKLTSFKQVGQFLGFTIFEPFYKANLFTNFLQTNLVDEMPLLDKMNKIVELYSSFNWKQSGIFTKVGPASLAATTNNMFNEASSSEKTIQYEYRINKTKPPYLLKKKKATDKTIKKIQRRLSNTEVEPAFNNLQQGFAGSKKSFITFQDLKRYLVDYTAPNPTSSSASKLDLSLTLKSSPILNQVFIAPSKIHKLGLFSRKYIKKHSIVIEYVGEIVSQSVADLREKRFHYGCYLFSILKEPNKQNQDKKDIIDATFRGNMARYLNHSCDPNCKAKTEYVNGSPRIIIYTIRDIAQFQQITYDYQFNVDAVQKLQCTCGAKNCQGRLN